MRISFTSDFGLADGWVGVCHDVMLRISPRLQVIDLAHDVPPFDVSHGAVVLAAAVPYLTTRVDLAVVDPGVGGQRRRVLIEAGDHLLVGPDNGLLGPAARRRGGASRAWELTNPELWAPTVSATFEARDVFAPVAAHVAGGLDLYDAGDEIPVEGLVAAPWREPVFGESSVDCEVAAVDRFGAVRLTIDATFAPMPDRDLLELAAPASARAPVARTFSDLEVGELFWTVDSSGFWTLAAREASASSALGLSPGTPVRVNWD